MNFRHIFMTGFAITLLFSSCKQNSDESPVNRTTGIQQEPSDGMFREELPGDKDSKLKTASTSTDVTNTEQNFNTQDKRMIIRSGTASIEVDKFDDAGGKVNDLAKKYNGYITNTSSIVNPNDKKQGTLTIRVPADKFDALLSELPNIGKVMNENISGKDITEEYMDAEARLKTQQELESRLLKLLSEKTASLTNVVEVETKLAGVRENIERIQGRMRYLKDQSLYSTLAVSLYEPSLIQTSTGGGFFYELGDAVRKGLRGFTTVLAGLITIIIAFIPILAILGLIFYFLKRYLKRRKLKLT